MTMRRMAHLTWTTVRPDWWNAGGDFHDAGVRKLLTVLTKISTTHTHTHFNPGTLPVKTCPYTVQN